MAENSRDSAPTAPATLDDAPHAGQQVEHGGKLFTTIKEGLAYILVPEDTPTSLDPKTVKNGLVESQSVFYNPIQQFNRDLSVLAIKAYGEDLMAVRKSRAELKAKRTRQRPHRGEMRGVKRKADEQLSAEPRGHAFETLSERNGASLEQKVAKMESSTEAAAGVLHRGDLATDLNSTGQLERKEAKISLSNESTTAAVDHEALAVDPDSASHPEQEGANAIPLTERTTAALNHEVLTTDSTSLSRSEQNRNSSEAQETTIGQTQTNMETTEPHRVGLDDNQHDQIDRLHYKTSFKILDALSATGLRALRYAQEIPFATSITANDLSPQAVDSIAANVKHNKQDKKIKPLAGNALTHMYGYAGKSTDGDSKYEGRYDVIDLDPYGTAVPFLDAAMHALNDGGLLCVTCTDAGVFASCGYPEKAYSLYGGTPAKGLHGHEGGLRLILHAIASSAARQGMSIEPLLTLSIDFYARTFVRVYRSAAEVKLLAGKTMLVYNCDAGCGAWQTQFLARNQPLKGKDGKVTNYKHSLGQVTSPGTHCEHCGFKLHISGPMYGGPLHHPAFIEAILDALPDLDKSTYATVERMKGMLTTALEETLLEEGRGEEVRQESRTEQQQKAPENSTGPIPRADAAQIDANPFFFIPSALAKVIHCQAPPEHAIRGALRHAGYEVTRSHAKPGSIRTNAPWSFVWEVMREWVRQKAPIKEENIKPGTPGWGIMKRRMMPGAELGSIGNKDDGAVEAAEVVAAPVSETDVDEEKVAGEAKTAISRKESDDLTTNGAKNGRGVVFDETLGRQTRGRRIVRYPNNPRENWGPMNRAKKSR